MHVVIRRMGSPLPVPVSDSHSIEITQNQPSHTGVSEPTPNMPDSDGEAGSDKLQIVDSDGLFTMPDTKSGQYPHESPGHQGLESLLPSKTDESSSKKIPQNKDQGGQ
jgi:hypothetical protein